MPHGIMSLPPKMAAQFAERARRGEGRHLGSQCYDFIQGTQRISLVSIDPPIGHIQKITQEQAEIEKELQPK